MYEETERDCKHRAPPFVIHEYLNGEVWRELECPTCGKRGRLLFGFTRIEWGHNRSRKNERSTTTQIRCTGCLV